MTISPARQRIKRDAKAARGLCLIVLLSWLLPVVQAFGQEIEIDSRSQEIIDRCVEAMGGETKLARFKSFQAIGPVTSENRGDEMQMEYRVFENQIWMSADDVQFVAIDNGRMQWMKNNDQVRQLNRRNDPGFNSIFPFGPFVLRWKDSVTSIRFVGETEFDGIEVFELNFQPAEKDPITRYFDKQTGLLVGQHMEGTSGDLVMRYEYDEIDGVQWVVKMSSKSEPRSNQLMEFKYDLGFEVDESIFNMPEKLREQLDKASEDDADKKPPVKRKREKGSDK